MPDLQTTDQQAKAQQAALLQAVAEQGQRGATQYQQQADANAATRQAAMQQAVGRALSQGGPDSTGAPEALVSQLRAQAAAPGDQRAADISAATTNQAQDTAFLGAANNDYMNQLQAAIPVLDKSTMQQVAAIKARQEEDAAQRAQQLQLGQLSIQQAQLGLENTKAQGAAAAAAAARQSATESVAQQKYNDQQALQDHQSAVINMASQAGASGSAFNFIAGDPANGNLQAALADLDQSLVPPFYSPWGGAGPTPFEQHFPGADPEVVRALITAFFAPPGAAGQSFPSTAPPVSSIPGIGAIANR